MNVITFLYTLPGIPLGYLFYFIYEFLCSNVGLAIIIFTFVVKAAMLPLSIKQQKNQAKTAVFTPKIREIQKKYANNREKQQEEMMKLQEQGYKPMGGCGSMFLSFLILFGVIDVVYKPLTHLVHLSSDKIKQVVEESYNIELTSAIVDEVCVSDNEVLSLNESDAKKHESIIRDTDKLIDYYNEHCLKDGESAVDISVFKELTAENVKMIKTAMNSIILEEYADNEKATTFAATDFFRITDEEKEELNALETDEEKEEYRAEHAVSSAFSSLLSTLGSHYGGYKVSNEDSVTFTPTGSMQRELFALERFGTETDRYVCKDVYSESVIRSETKAELERLYDNLNFVGIKLGQVPKDNMGFPMILVPIVSFLMALAQTYISNKINQKSNPEAAAVAGSAPMKIMMYIMPLISLWIAFTVPAGAGFYWTVSYVFGIIQTLVLNKLLDPAKLREKAEADWQAAYAAEKKRRSIDTEPVKVVDENGNEETISQKELNRRKLAAARKAQAEKYGEEYHDDDDNNDE